MRQRKCRITCCYKFSIVLPLLIHLAKTPLSPEVLYRNLSELAGELSTYVRPQTRRPEEYKEYKHLTPYAGLKSVVDEVQYLLNAVLIRGRSGFRWKRGLMASSMRWLNLPNYRVSARLC